jgi:hypothetical protein
VKRLYARELSDLGKIMAALHDAEINGEISVFGRSGSAIRTMDTTPRRTYRTPKRPPNGCARPRSGCSPTANLLSFMADSGAQ